MNKNLVDSLKKRKIDKEAFGDADTTNKEGFPAFTKSLEESFTQIMFAGVTTNTFYASSNETFDEYIPIIEKFTLENPKRAAEIISAARKEGFKRSFPILGLVYLSTVNSDEATGVNNSKTLFKETFQNVVNTGNDLEDFLDIAKHVRCGFGRAVKTAIKQYIDNNLNPYYATKYKKQFADAVSIARPKTDDPIFGYVMTSKKSISNNYDSLDESEKSNYVDIKEVQEALDKYPKLKATEFTKNAFEEENWEEAVATIKKYRLNPATFLGIKNPPSQVWKALASQMGVMMYLKYLNKLINENAIDKKVFEEKLTVNNLKKASVFPFRVYTAYKYIKDNNTSVDTDKDYVLYRLSDLINDYAKEYDWTAWKDLSISLGVDVSGSMTSSVKGSYLTPITIAAMFTGFFVAGIEDTTPLPFDGDVRLNMKKEIDLSNTAMGAMKIVERSNGGWTNINSPIDYMIKSKVQCDLFIGITDSIEYGEGFIKSWIEYKKKNPSAKAVLIRVDSYNTNPISQEHKEKYDIHQVYGWNDSVVGYIEKFVLTDVNSLV